MAKLLKRIIGNQEGQALPAVLALLVLGGLTIAPMADYASTNLNSSRIINKSINGIYAAEAGIEDTLWRLKNSLSPVVQLTQNINNMQVAIQTEDMDTFTLYFGELIQAGAHSNYLSTDGGMVWDAEAQAYKYTITVTWESNPGTPVIHLTEVGARLPEGYSYQTGSSALFTTNLSTAEPGVTSDTYGACMLNWEFDNPLPSVSTSDPVATQTFYVTGEGELEGDYTWVVANRGDVGAVGEISGNLYQITSTATLPEDGTVTATIVMDVMFQEHTPHIVTWKTLK